MQHAPITVGLSQVRPFFETAEQYAATFNPFKTSCAAV